MPRRPLPAAAESSAHTMYVFLRQPLPNILSCSVQAFSLEEAMSAVSASLKAAEKKLVQVDETSSQGISEAERRMSARVQMVVNAQMAVNEEVFHKTRVF